MEPEAAAFLKRIAKSIFIGFLWLAITSTIAIKGDNAFIEGPFRLGNVLFYAWFVISLVGLVLIYKRLWANKQNIIP